MSQKQVLLHRGEKFASEGSGRFAKDVIHVGKWTHPISKRDVTVTPERLAKLVENTTRYKAAGNKIPFRDGHKNSVLANMGEWTGPFIVHQDKLVAVVEPKDPKAIAGLSNGSIDGVSVVIDYDVTDSKKNHYDEVITAIDATDFPVVTEQEPFMALSRDTEGCEVFYPESLMLAKTDPDNDGDVMAQHDALHDDLKTKVAEFSKKKAKLGADHADTKAAGGKAQDAAMRVRKQAQIVHDHVQNMTGGAVYYGRIDDDHREPSPAAAGAEEFTLEKVLEELARPTLSAHELAKFLEIPATPESGK